MYAISKNGFSKEIQRYWKSKIITTKNRFEINKVLRKHLWYTYCASRRMMSTVFPWDIFRQTKVYKAVKKSSLVVYSNINRVRATKVEIMIIR